MQTKNLLKMLQVGLALIYPVLAVLIWFLPLFENKGTLTKIIISTLLCLYGVFRMYRFLKKPVYEDENE